MAIIRRKYEYTISTKVPNDIQEQYSLLRDKISGFEIIIIKPFDYIEEFYENLPTDKIPALVKDALLDLKTDISIAKKLIPSRCPFNRYTGYNAQYSCCGFFAPIVYYIEKIELVQETVPIAQTIGVKRPSDDINLGFDEQKTDTHSKGSLKKRRITGAGGKPKNTIQQIRERAGLFYKVVSAYGTGQHPKDTKSWLHNAVEWHNIEDWKNPLGNKMNMRPGTPYIFNIFSRTGRGNERSTKHHMYAKRVRNESGNEDYVIMADSWCWHTPMGDTPEREENIRAMKYEDFRRLVQKINSDCPDCDRALTNSRTIFVEPCTHIVKNCVNEIDTLISHMFFIPYIGEIEQAFEEPVYLIPMKTNILNEIIQKINYVDSHREQVKTYGGAKTYRKRKQKSHRRKTSRVRGR